MTTDAYIAKNVAIVVPIYKVNLTFAEEISLKHLLHFLKKYDLYLVTPESMEVVDYPGFTIIQFNDHFFNNIASYSRLLLSRCFYESFVDYKYILIYQLDCLVFSDNLTEWCEKGFDYFGAPWFRSKIDPSQGFSRVGNGGLSLRKIESFLRVIDSQRYVEESVSYWTDLLSTPLGDINHLPKPHRYLKRLQTLHQAHRGVRWYTSQYTLNEDHFWSDRAKLFYPDFKVPPVDTALSFSFERFPRYCFEQNHRCLPFGCHAWAKWDQRFWEPYLLR